MDVNGTLIRGYAFNQKRISRISAQINEGDIVFVHNAEVEESNLDVTWIDTPVQLKLTDGTQFQVSDPDASFPMLSWNFTSIEQIKAEDDSSDPFGIINLFPL